MSARMVIYGTLAISGMALGIEDLTNYILSKDTYREYLLQSWHEENPLVVLTSDRVLTLETSVEDLTLHENTGWFFLTLSGYLGISAFSKRKKE